MIIKSVMKRKLSAFLLLFSAIFTLSSCLSDDSDDVSYYDDTAITAFVLGNVTRYTSSDTTTYAGSSYKFVIDQGNHLIYNLDSLPSGSNIKRVLATITTKNGGVAVFESDNDSLLYYSSVDSVDFTKVHKVRVYANSRRAYAVYTIQVNVHQEDAKAFRWAGEGQNNLIASFTDLKAVANNGKMFAFGVSGGNTKVLETSESDVNGWSELSPNVTFNAEAYKSAVASDGYLYILNGSQVLRSADGIVWNAMGRNSSLNQLLGFSGNRLFARTESGIAMSEDGGATWTQETLNSSLKNLPTENLSMVSLPITTNDSTELITLVGNRNASYGDTISVVWNKIAEFAQNSENQNWVYSAYDANDPDKAPLLEQFTAVAYNGRIEAYGSNGIFYQSKNNGLSWTKDAMIEFPEDFTVSPDFGFAVDSNNFLWIINAGNGQVVKGRHAEAGWKRKDN